MSLSLERLRQWRQQAGDRNASVAEVHSKAHTPAQAPMREHESTAERLTLQRLLYTRHREVAKRCGTPTRHVADAPRVPPGDEIAPGLWLREQWMPQAIPTQSLSLAFAKRHDETIEPSDLLFFDTETTGLSGGVGTRAFMIGAADWTTNAENQPGLRVRQLTLSTLAAEAAMLRVFASWLGPRTVLSSYNGRCYDAPLLKARYRLARLPEPLSALDHVDLLFPTRRFWRGIWENCRLATIERHLLDIVRNDDLPGSEAPAAWLGYLRGGDAHNLHRVAAHNHQDVVTLAALFLRLIDAQTQSDSVMASAVAHPGLPRSIRTSSEP